MLLHSGHVNFAKRKTDEKKKEVVGEIVLMWASCWRACLRSVGIYRMSRSWKAAVHRVFAVTRDQLGNIFLREELLLFYCISTTGPATCTRA